MSLSKSKASKQFVDDFALVAKHYMLAEHGELELAKQMARDDMANAEISYRALANEISNGVAA